MPGRTTNGGDYRFGFNGKENDNEMKGNGNSLDFGARIYDPRIGRWLSPDPLFKVFPGASTYSYAGNNPIFYIDREGKVIVPANAKSKATFEAHITKIFGASTTGSFSKLLLEAVNGSYSINYADFDAAIKNLDPDKQAAARMYFIYQNRKEKFKFVSLSKEDKLRDFLTSESAKQEVGEQTAGDRYENPNDRNPGEYIPDGKGGTIFVDETVAMDPKTMVLIDNDDPLKPTGSVNTDEVIGHEFGEGFAILSTQTGVGAQAKDKGYYRQKVDIQIDNIFRRILGLKGVRSGEGHGTGQGVANPEGVPKELSGD